MLDYLINNIFRNPPVLLALVAMLGLILQKKKISDIVKGTILAAVGMFILQEGVTFLAVSIVPINVAFQSSLGATVTEGLNDQTFTALYGGQIGLSMLIGFGLHILIARFTPLKNIFLTGHFLWWIPFIFVAVGVEAGLSGTYIVLFAAVFSSIYWSVIPWLLRPFVRDITGDDSFTLGHPSGILALVAGLVARKFGNKEKSTEDIKLPQGLSFFREIAITGGIIIFIMYIIVGIALKGAFASEGSLVFYAIGQGLKFGGGLTILLTGVRMLVNQLVPAFQGISMKLVPNAIPALDCPILFNYKPTAVLIGFIVAMINSSILIILASYFNTFGVILIPLVITSFFECGTAAVIAEGQGGLRGAIIGTIVASSLMVLLLGLSISVFSGTIQNWIMIFGGNDLSLWGIIANFFAKLIGG